MTSTALTSLTEEERTRALDRFRMLCPFLEQGVPLTTVAKENGVALRTLWRWVERYRHGGLAALGRKAHSDRRKQRLSPLLQQVIEGFALQKPRLSCAAIHRKAAGFAQTQGEPPPSYMSVYRLIRRLDPALLALAHEGTKASCEPSDSPHRREAEAPNAVWHADHAELDIWIIGDDGQPRKPWLTIILDDYSRAVAGYLLSFSAPSAIETSLVLRQAIWRKAQARWHVCGIPQILYTDHGRDFTSRHLEQVAADLKIQLIFSGTDRPCGGGKCERFFSTMTEVLLARLPGHAPGAAKTNAVLTLPELAGGIERYLINEYLVTSHSATGQPPQSRWEAGGFLPQMPESLERLDLLLLTVPKARRIHQGGIRFMGLRYIDPTLTAYVGEEVVLRYDPRDMAEIRLFYRDRFLCRAICQELASETVTLGEIISARNHRRRQSRQTLGERRRLVDSLLEAKRWAPATQQPEPPTPPPVKLKRYFCDE